MNKSQTRSSSLSFGVPNNKTKHSLASLINLSNIDRVVVEEPDFIKKKLTLQTFQYNPDHIAKNVFSQTRKSQSLASSMTDIPVHKSTAFNSKILPSANVSISQSQDLTRLMPRKSK
jgi:hypothetical protein